jgi:2-iminoacetate synthase
MLHPDNENQWMTDRIKAIETYLANEKRKDFVDDGYIEELIAHPSILDRGRVDALIQKSKELKGLSQEETAYLLNIEDEEVWREIYKTARIVKDTVYGNRIVLFAPLYLSNHCVNNCHYCGFRSSNKKITHKNLTDAEILAEIKALTRVGHKRTLLVLGEHIDSDVSYITHAMKLIYGYRNGRDEIRRVNVNAAPMFVDEYKLIKEAKIGTYQIFQETYHKKTYQKMHPRDTIKNSYYWRLFGLHRAQEAGIDDVAIGALFGLYKWKFEVLALLAHAQDMEKEFGVGSHTISFPRLEPALGTPFLEKLEHKVSDGDFRKIIAILRLAVPYTGLILTARETPELRREAMHLGVSQTDAGTRIAIGGYNESAEGLIPDREQFQIADARSLDAFISELLEEGFIPSFCTADYRCGRTGCEFMTFAKSGRIKKFCVPNAILTFKEYLVDYASEEVKRSGEKIIANYIQYVGKNDSEKAADTVKDYLKRIESGERDLYF